jgi:uncharacterized integral membrane protein
VLRRFVTLIVLVPLAVVIIAFAMANRESVRVSFDPFSASDPAAAVTLPLFVLIIVLLIIGVLIGGSASWIRQGRWRGSARRFERELRHLRDKLSVLESAAGKPASAPEERKPPPRLSLKPPAG